MGTLRRGLLFLLVVLVIVTSIHLQWISVTRGRRNGHGKQLENSNLLEESHHALQTLKSRYQGQIVVREEYFESRKDKDSAVDVGILETRSLRAKGSMAEAETVLANGDATGSTGKDHRFERSLEDRQVQRGADGGHSEIEKAREWCTRTKRDDAVVPGQSWGTLSNASIERWKAERCDRFFCKPDFMEGRGMYQCESIDE